MSRKDQYIEPDNAYYEPSRDPSQGTLLLVVILTVLSVILTAVLAIIYLNKKNAGDVPLASGSDVNGNDTYISVATVTPTPMPPLSADQNAILYPPSAIVNINASSLPEIDPAADPSVRGLTQTVMTSAQIITDYSRENPVYMGDPLYYSSVAGILTYRGNNFRNTATFGYTTPSNGVSCTNLEQVWEFSGIGSKLSSTQTYEWTGLQLTGQPLVVTWSSNVRYSMNIYPEKVSKEGLTEVIVAALDGYVYFFDIDDGAMTRDPIYVGFSVKGTPAVDPRGYPLLYLGQGDDNADDEKFGMYIYSLIDGTRLYSYEGGDDGAYRMNWNAFDSSPVIDAASDTLIWPCENGIIYTFRLNTQYVLGGVPSINPQCTGYKYIFNDTQGRFLGVESSIAVYGGYGYFVDNNSNLICLDLNSLEMLWCLRLGDDSDVTPVIEEQDGIPYVYIGTEVDNQGGQGTYSGAAYIYKINGLTGEVIWQNSYSCYTYNGQSSDSDQSGGCIGNPIIGKAGTSISNLVIFSFSMTHDLASGNTIVAYYKDSGTMAWSYQMNIYTYSSPVDLYDQNGNAYIVIADSIGQIHLVDALTGERINYIQTARYLGTDNETTNGVVFEASPVVYENTMIIGTRSGSIFGITID